MIIDTNVLMAALIKKTGSNHSTLRKILDPNSVFNICYSSQIIDEYTDVLFRSPISSRGLTQEAKALVELLLSVGTQIVPKFIPALVYPDIKDRPFLEAAVYANAILLTNNLRDFPFLGVNVIAPDEFIEWCDLTSF